jgi:hypothetical protein
LDSTRQKSGFAELNDLFLDESFVMTLASVLPVQVARSAVRGMVYSRHEDILHTDTWLDS